MGLISLSQQIRTGVTVLHTVFGVVMVIAFVLAETQSRKYADWHHLLTMEIILSERLDLEKLMRPKQIDVGEEKIEGDIETTLRSQTRNEK